MTFEDYVLSRSYNFGRGSDDAWRFLLIAKGDESLRKAGDRQSLERLLAARSCDADVLRGAQSVWNSFQHRRWSTGAAQASRGSAPKGSRAAR